MKRIEKIRTWNKTRKVETRIVLLTRFFRADKRGNMLALMERIAQRVAASGRKAALLKKRDLYGDWYAVEVEECKPEELKKGQ